MDLNINQAIKKRNGMRTLRVKMQNNLRKDLKQIYEDIGLFLHGKRLYLKNINNNYVIDRTCKCIKN